METKFEKNQHAEPSRERVQQADQQIIAAVDRFFDSGGKRYDDITLASHYVRLMSEIPAHSGEDVYRTASVNCLITLLTELSNGYQLRKYGIN